MVGQVVDVFSGGWWLVCSKGHVNPRINVNMFNLNQHKNASEKEEGVD